MEYFSGTYNLMLDQKNRMRLPAKFRALLGGKFFILNGAGGCLMVMDEARFNALAEKMSAIPLSAVKARRAVVALMSNVVEPEEDAQGRFVLPSKTRAYANISKNIVVLGGGDYVEIWSEESYNNIGLDADVDFENALSALSEFGI